ncbi:MAG: prepilin peptidase [Acetobacteraceae bacterium]
MLLVVAAMHDLMARTVPNRISLLLALTGSALAIADGRLPASLACGLAVFVTAALCWRRGWLGGGDVKLLGAAAVAVPPLLVMPFLVAMSLTGAALGLVYMAGRAIGTAPVTQRPQGLFRRVMRVERWRFGRGGPLPYACAIAAGGVFVLL